jgi:leucyl-tRNA synthetase
MMVFVNKIYKTKSISSKNFISFLVMLSTFAPHICEELFEKLKIEQIKNQT